MSTLHGVFCTYNVYVCVRACVCVWGANHIVSCCVLISDAPNCCSVNDSQVKFTDLIVPAFLCALLVIPALTVMVHSTLTGGYSRALTAIHHLMFSKCICIVLVIAKCKPEEVRHS